MFAASDSPPPMSMGDGGDPTGGEQIVAFVTPEVVPVRLVYNAPIPVVVTNFPGAPPPLPGGLKGPAALPPLPTRAAPKAPGGMGLGDLGLGNIVKLGTVAGIAAAGVGLVTEGFNELKHTFIDPILGAAKGGFDQGVSRGAGTEVLGKAFEVLGVSIGITLLPTVVKLSIAALALAEDFSRCTEDITAFIDGLVGSKASGEKEDSLATKALGFVSSLVPGGAIAFELNRGRKGADGKPAPFTPESLNEKSKVGGKEMNDVLDSLRMSMGAKPEFVGVADIRQQAQMAAMQDPLEAKMRTMQIQALEKFINETSGDMKRTAENTAPPGGHA